MSGIKLALNETVKAPVDPIARMKETLGVIEKELDRGDGPETVLCLAYSTGEGRGTGSENVPLDELPEYIEALSHYVQNGIDAVVQSEQGYQPSFEVIRDSIRKIESDNEDDRVSFRSRTGKGAKPQTFDLARFEDIVTVLNAVLPQVEDLQVKFAEAKAKAEADAAAKADAD